MNLVSCPKCNGIFNIDNINADLIILDVQIFNCPVCGEEINDLQCDYVLEEI